MKQNRPSPALCYKHVFVFVLDFWRKAASANSSTPYVYSIRMNASKNMQIQIHANMLKNLSAKYCSHQIHQIK